MWIQSFFRDINPILIVIIAFIVIYLSIKKLKLPGTDWTHAILSLLVSFIFVSSTRVTNYMISLVPFLILLATISFIIMITLAFTAKDIATFTKPLAWIGFTLAILICLGLAFNQFPTLNHMLPGTSDSHLTNELEDFKDFIYSTDFKESFIFVISIVIVCFFMIKK